MVRQWYDNGDLPIKRGDLTKKMMLEWDTTGCNMIWWMGQQRWGASERAPLAYHGKILQPSSTQFDVLLVEIEGPVWYTICHQLPIVKGVKQTPLLINPPMGKGHLWFHTFSNCQTEIHQVVVGSKFATSHLFVACLVTCVPVDGSCWPNVLIDNC